MSWRIRSSPGHLRSLTISTGFSSSRTPGAPALVMRSIFEEQIVLEQMAAHRHYDTHVDAEAGSIAPNDQRVCARSRRVPAADSQDSRTDVAQGHRVAQWDVAGRLARYARGLEQAGAHALELNLYVIATDAKRPSQEVEAEQLATVREVAKAVKIPVAVKLSPFYSSLPHFVAGLEAAGAEERSFSIAYTRPTSTP